MTRLRAGADQGGLNLPGLFVVLFALKSKRYEVATSTIAGPVLASVLLMSARASGRQIN
jgi:hypothetical protein